MKHTIALLLLTLSPHLASAKEFHVSVKGDDLNKGSASSPSRRSPPLLGLRGRVM